MIARFRKKPFSRQYLYAVSHSAQLSYSLETSKPRANETLVKPFLRNYHGDRATLLSDQGNDVNSMGRGNIINVTEGRTQLTGYDDETFQINNTYNVNSSILLLPKSWMLWRCEKKEDISLDRLKFLSGLFPPLEMLYIGCGKKTISPRDFPSDILAHFQMSGTIVEVTTTVIAAQTFNLLNGEDRNVGAALLPIEYTPTDDKRVKQSRWLYD